MILTRAVVLALDEFNRGIQRAADDYHKRPTRFTDPVNCDGHPYNPEPTPRHGRKPRCLTCNADRAREYRARKKNAA